MTAIHAVTIHHRGCDMLDVCLRTLLASTGVDLEVVVVLNGCDEELPPIVESSPRVHVVAAERPVGFSEANNLGVSFARTRFGEPDYWYFINNDTRSEADALALQAAALDADDAAAVAGPTLLIDWAPDHLNSLGLNVTDDAWGWDEGIGVALADYGPLPGRRPVTAVTGSAILVDAEVYRQVGGWTVLYDYYFEDIDLCLKVRSAGFEVIHEPAAVVGHHVSATMTLESDHKLFLFWRNRLVLAFVHWPLRLLARLLRIAVVDEILRGPADQVALRRRALKGALAKLPRALAARRRQGGRRDWVGMLRPRGSVPVITLPEKPTAGAARTPAATVPPGTWDAASRLAATAPHGRRVLVLGCAPLPFEDERMNLAPGARTWQLASALADDGHAVCVVAMRIPGACGPSDRAVDRVDAGNGGGPVVYSLDERAFRDPGVVESAVAVFRPDLVVGGSSAGPALRAVQVAGERPLWIDLFGDLMAEGQARLGVHPGDDLLACREVLEVLLERGDAFSAVSDRQRFAVLGQLGFTGRLNRETLGEELVHTVPCCVIDGVPEGPGALPELADPDIGPDDVVLLWSGGFNTWCDVATLLGGVERAMAADPRLRLVVTGGAVRGHDDRTYPEFLEGVAGSRFAGRILVRGELPARQAAAYRARADVGVVTERTVAERVLGSSGRVLQWLAEGLPVVCTGLSEVGADLEEQRLAFTYRPGDADDLARAVLEAAADPEAARARAGRARRHALERWSVAATTEPLRRWARLGRRAPDAGAANPLSVAALAELRAELDRERKRYHEVRSELGKIHQSRMWKTWMLYLTLPSFLRGGRRDRPGPPQGSGE